MNELIVQQITSNDENMDSAVEKALEIGCLIKLGAEIESKNKNFFLLAVLNLFWVVVEYEHNQYIQ